MNKDDVSHKSGVNLRSVTHYAVDVEMAWFRRFKADRALACLLLERQDRGDANIIDVGQVWHMCVNPAAAQRLRNEFEADLGA